MQLNFDQQPFSIYSRSPCPNCGKVGHTIQKWENPIDDRPIQMMVCSQKREVCQVSEYYPETLEDN